MTTSIIRFVLLATVLVSSACTKKTQETVPLDPQAALFARGKSTYMAQCISCHASDPSKDGSLGPAIAGSSRELLEARVLRAEYPPGYTPKRTSKIMPAMPFMKSEIDALHAYLSSTPSSK